MIFTEKKTKGDILIMALVFGAIALVIIPALVRLSIVNLETTTSYVDKQKALQIAEAGIDYYKWHLAYAPTDYKDGSTSTGPYIHDFYDKNGDAIGQYILTITPPPTGSTLVTVDSVGKVNDNPGVSKEISAQLAIPSLAQYAIVANDDMRFGTGTVVVGPIRSNGGIRFDGTAYNVVSSAKTTYVDPDTGLTEFGVFTSSDPQPPAPVPNNTSVFVAGRQFPVDIVDFPGITYDLAQIKSDSDNGGIHLGPSGKSGYHIVFKTNKTFDLYKVNTLYTNRNCPSQSQTGWGMWSISPNSGSETFVKNYPIPSNGLIFVEDDVWVDGQINGSRVTIGAGVFPDNPNTRKNITVNKDLLYTKFDGSDSIALVAQNNINVGLLSNDTLTIDGALMAQNGRVGRFYYSSGCGADYIRSTINLYGMIGTNVRYGFAYTDNTGYLTRNLNYDGNFLYAPPPSFPLSSDQYKVVSWKELQ